ncbi:MAG: hypothetical protein RLZZ455_60 [Candidatus Parcubacteria bacterium]|jgi:hypothetical protein
MNRGEIHPISGSVVEVAYSGKEMRHAAYGVRREQGLMTLVYSELFPTRAELLATAAPVDAVLSPDKRPIIVELSYGEIYERRDESGELQTRIHGHDATTHDVAPYQAHHDRWIGETPRNSEEMFHVTLAQKRERLCLVAPLLQEKSV